LASTWVLHVILDLAALATQALALRVIATLFAFAVPALTLLGYHAGTTSRSRFAGAMLFGATTLLGVLLALPLLYVLVPHYPRHGPNELVAAVIAASPVVLTTVGVTLFATRLNYPHWAWPSALVLCLAFVACSVRYWGVPEELRLPLNAEIERYRFTDHKDFYHESLRVDGVPRESAAAYAEALGLPPSDSAPTCGPSQGMGGPIKPIWQPPSDAAVWARTGTRPRGVGGARADLENCRSLVGWHAGTLRFCLDCTF
jgi:hypothetical protein